MTKRIRLFFSVLILFSNYVSFSQISANPQTGCAPLGVTFTGAAGASNPLWTFGDGVTSNQTNPTHTYATKGTYVVTYTATNVAGTKTLSINVFGKPSPSFTVTSPTQGCIPYVVTFKDNSTGGGGSAINTWQWAFGDGGTNAVNSATQSYTYNVGGQFNVSVKITDANGCDSSVTLNNLVVVSKPPTISLSTNPSPAAACTPPLTVTFNASGSTSHSPLTNTPSINYLWTFSNGSNSTLSIPPAQTYTAMGSYPVKIKLTDANHCSDSLVTTVTIKSPTATFTTADTVCLTASFNATGSTLGAGQNWSFGDGGTGTVGNHTYTSSGHYTVSLTVNSGACSSTYTRSVFVESPVANFSVSPSYMCNLPKTVQLTNTSTPSSGSTYQWIYYQQFSQYGITPLTSTSVSPTFTLTHLDTNRYTINTLDIMDSITVLMTTSHGCKAYKKLIYMDTIYLSTARFVPSFYEGCVPLTVTFADSSRVGPHEHITSWKYLFGDGASTTIAAAPGNTNHTYTSTGIYYPKLVIQTQDGCGDTSYTIKIEVGKKPVASFSVSPASVCIGDNVQFTNTTPAADSVDTWHYYGDGNYYVSSCSDNPNPNWSFTHSTGPQNISMVACFRGCCDSVTQAAAVTVKGPLGTFSAAMNCDSSFVYNFSGNMSAATTWTWDFGDGTIKTNSTAVNISHTYSVTGDYNVILTTFNPGTGCNPYIDTVKIHVRDIKAKFTYDTLLCSTVPYVFDASTSSNVYTFGNNGYTWFWGDNSHPDITSNPIINHVFSGHGSYTVTLITKDKNGCPDTTKKVIKAFSITAAFNPKKYTLCTNSTMTFSNTSTADTTILKYIWSFGDGSPTDTTKNPSHTYSLSPTTNSVVVTLTAISALGCTATVQKTLIISHPNASFQISTNVNICSGEGVTYTSTNSYPNMTWSFGDGTTVGPTPPQSIITHSYTSSGVYTTTLTVSDTIGCMDVKTNNQVVNVQNIPIVSISSAAFGNSNLCYPYQASFTDNSTVTIFASRVWNLYNGTILNNNLSTINYLYSAPGTYSVSLTETTTNGCTASVTNTFVVNGPVADFTLSPSTICRGQSITFTIKDTTNVSTWAWDFGDGTDTTKSSPVSHTYNFHPPGGSTNVTLIYWGVDSSCKQAQVHPINIYQVIADFKRNNELTKADTAHCLGSTDVFTNTSTNASTYGWNFGNGANSAAFSPSYQYTVSGTYTVELFIKDNTTGCVDTMKKKMIIYPLFVNEVAKGDSICKNANAQLNASGNAVTFTWTPSNGLSSANVANPSASPSVTTTYTLYATDMNGCKDSSIATIFVQPAPIPIIYDTTIVIGQTVVLPGSQGPGYSYTWTPTNNLSCNYCPNPVFNGTVNASYIETIADNRGCFKVNSTFSITVEPLASLNVPTAFTPNGDGTNDVIYAAGWGIKTLLYFKIFNRWGELVFESTDLKVGWDGTYKGVPQNMETYVYEVSALPFISDNPITKKGYFKLLR